MSATSAIRLLWFEAQGTHGHLQFLGVDLTWLVFRGRPSTDDS